jgi:hypothetical protein
MLDLTRPPPDCPASPALRVELLAQQLERIEKARRLGWRMDDIQEALCAELGLGELSAGSFAQALHKARKARQPNPNPSPNPSPNLGDLP